MAPLALRDVAYNPTCLGTRGVSGSKRACASPLRMKAPKSPADKGLGFSLYSRELAVPLLPIASDTSNKASPLNMRSRQPHATAAPQAGRLISGGGVRRSAYIQDCDSPALMSPVPSWSSASHTARTVRSETAPAPAPVGIASWSLTR